MGDGSVETPRPGGERHLGPDMERSATLSDRFTSVPDGWDKATADQVQYAMDQVWTALNHEDVVTRVERYYRKDGNFAGATFLGLDPVDPYRFTSADLLSLNLLSVVAQPVAIRRLLEPSRERGHLLRLLSEENLPLDADLAMADDGQLVAMADLHEALKRVLSPADVRNPNPWVTASKLCARKRPDLFPVRDNVVVKYLGLDRPKGNYQVDWQVFRHVIQDNAIRRRLDAIVDEASRSPGVDVGHPNWRLRHLDVVLWMRARPQDARSRASTSPAPTTLAPWGSRAGAPTGGPRSCALAAGRRRVLGRPVRWGSAASPKP